MLILSSFINNLINNLIRNLDMPVRVFISFVFICAAVTCFYISIKSQPKGKPGLRIGWLILFIISTILSVLYLII